MWLGEELTNGIWEELVPLRPLSWNLGSFGASRWGIWEENLEGLDGVKSLEAVGPCLGLLQGSLLPFKRCMQCVSWWMCGAELPMDAGTQQQWLQSLITCSSEGCS